MGQKIKNAILISNRGPDFTCSKSEHFAIGGTKGIYPQLMYAFCKKWICLAKISLNVGPVISDYGDKLDVLFIKDDIYNKYYYEFVSEYLYPYLLGFSNLAIRNGENAHTEVVKKIAAEVNKNNNNDDVIICDYHLYSLPGMLNTNGSKVFFWFIPFLNIDKYDNSIIPVLQGLNEADMIYVFDDVWAENLKNLFFHFMPDSTIRVSINSLMMGPDEFYINGDGCENIDLKKYIPDIPMDKRLILSVSRMDFVKEIPLLIKGFERFLQQSKDDESVLVIFAPHHRPDSSVYKGEHNKIYNLVKGSIFADRIFLCNDHLSSSVLKSFFKQSDMFICPSVYDAMPLTPLEYALANNGGGSLLLSDSIGSYRLLQTLCYSFKSGDYVSLANNIEYALYDNSENKEKKLRIMKEVISESTIQKAIIKLKNDWGQDEN